MILVHRIFPLSKSYKSKRLCQIDCLIALLRFLAENPTFWKAHLDKDAVHNRCWQVSGSVPGCLFFHETLYSLLKTLPLTSLSNRRRASLVYFNSCSRSGPPAVDTVCWKFLLADGDIAKFIVVAENRSYGS